MQPNLAEASQQVDAFMAAVDREQGEVSELEKVGGGSSVYKRAGLNRLSFLYRW